MHAGKAPAPWCMVLLSLPKTSNCGGAYDGHGHFNRQKLPSTINDPPKMLRDEAREWKQNRAPLGRLLQVLVVISDSPNQPAQPIFVLKPVACVREIVQSEFELVIISYGRVACGQRLYEGVFVYCARPVTVPSAELFV